MRSFLLLLLAVNSAFGQVWSRLADFPGTKRDDGVAVVVNNKAYFGTGLQEGWSATIDWFCLDLASNTWKQIPDMPHTTERQYGSAFPGPSCFFVFGGDGVSGTLNNLYKYDIATSTWSLMAPKPGAGVAGACCFSFGDRIIIACGRLQAAGSTNKEVWEYTISSNTWQQKNNISFPGRWRAGGTALHNYGYLLFGIDSSGTFRRELYRYDHNLDTWTKISDFPMANGRAYAAIESAAQKLFVFGGYDSTNTYYNDTWSYNDITNTWAPENTLPSFGRKGGMFCAANDNFYYTCGINKSNTRLNETWMTDVPLALSKKEKEPSLKIFPVPCKNILTLGLVDEAVHNVIICSLEGRELLNFKGLSGTEVEIDLSSLSEGVYFLKLFSGGSFAGCKRIVKSGE